jgi:hypothetical protein
MLMASAGGRKTDKPKQADEDDGEEEKKTLSQQIAEGKYGLIDKEIYATTPKRPGIISYASNPEVPRDTAKNLGGLEPEEIWLAENHVLVLRGGFFPEHKFNRTDESATAWPPIDNFNAPRRQVKIPANPKVPPPFPVQLTDDGPTQFIGFNATAGQPPFPPFFPQPPPGNGSYFAPPFPFPPPGNFTPGFYPPIPPGNFTSEEGFYPPPGNGSFFQPQFPYPLPPPRNGSYFGPPPGNFTPGSERFYPPPFPGFPLPPYNATFNPPYPLPPNVTFPFPPPFLNLPPGAAFLPPPGNLTVPFDEDDPSLYYPPPYDFYYPKDNSTPVPPGPLVPGIILPPPPNFFAPLNTSEEHSEHYPTSPATTTEPPVTHTLAPPYGAYLPGLSRPPAVKNRRPSLSYTPITTAIRKKPCPTVNIVENDALNHITPASETYVLTTPTPDIQKLDPYSEKPPCPPININPHNVQVTHKGKSPIEQIPHQGYYYEKPAIVFTPAPETVYGNVQNVVLTTAVPDVSYYSVPVTDIIVQPTPTLQRTKNVPKQNTPVQPAKTYYQPEPATREESPMRKEQGINIPMTTLAPHPIYYNSQRQPLDTETNTVTPSPQPYNLKPRSGAPVTPSPPVSYYTAPSVSNPRNPSSVKASYYFYEEPSDRSRHVSDAISSVTTQALPSKYEEPSTTSPVRYYNEQVSSTPQSFINHNAPSAGGKSAPTKDQQEQYVYSDVLPIGHSLGGVSPPDQPQQYVYSDALPAEPAAKNPPQTVHSQVYSDILPAAAPVKGPTQSEQYIYSGIVPGSQANGVRIRTQPQSYVGSSPLPVDQQVIFTGRSGKYAQGSTPAPPQYYYVTVSPSIQYEVEGSTAPSITNQKYPIQQPQQELIKSTPQPTPLVSKLVYFTTPRTNFAYHDTSSQRPITYNIQPSSSPRPIYQYSYDKNVNNVESQQPRQQNIYTTTRTKYRKPQRLNSQGEVPVVSSIQYQSTPRTLFEYSYEQSTKAPEIQQFYSALSNYDQEDVSADSPAAHYGYEDSREQSKQRHEYQSTPRPRSRGHQRPQVPQVNTYPTANPFHTYFTRQDETLLDDITKKYFTIFGQKLPSGDANVATTPIPPYTQGNVQSQSKRPYVVNTERQYYTTSIPNYSIQKSENPSVSDHAIKVPVSLADDININYKKPSPPVNPLSEFIDTRQLSNLEPGGALVSYKFPGDGGHFYFITPQLVGAEQSQEHANGYLYSPPNQVPPQLVTYRRKKRREQR